MCEQITVHAFLEILMVKTEFRKTILNLIGSILLMIIYNE